ncbi:helix-turn-helix transcriptional regulator [Nocardiopsis sp. RSe5-2]|uniref:Helix-turn-helix transcriptional regulator n=1 Tax=Nocardiopsis endophytica TaxID=3018445 RepID=A0ABT4U9L0_9ACTN|nr:helix-turn-helix transcriptional regulator [Nocardiopsis endophytica]MDA2813154.1 helix-turn-helix transcriptional regulator [Nocardiopsis endophytica]
MDTPSAVQTPLELYGREVRRLRLTTGLTLEGLGRMVGSNKSQLSRLENGQYTPPPALRDALDDVLAAHGELTRQWAEANGDSRPDWRGEIAAATRNARAVYDFQALAFPSYLQTEKYAEALIEAAFPALPSDELTRRVQERVQRAEQIRDALRPLLCLVIDRTALARRYGGPAAAAEQLEYIARLTSEGRVTAQIVPEDLHSHPGNSGSFRVLNMPDGRDIAYVESAEQGQLLTRAGAVARHRELFAQLQAVAWSPSDSLKAIEAEVDRIRE